MKWISVKDKLPESPENGSIPIIICSYSEGRDKHHVSCVEFQKDNFYSYGERIIIDDCYWTLTHWMPLPEPPDKE